jgi:PBP1b-binding outer membrane lipoprotein LpoB
MAKRLLLVGGLLLGAFCLVGCDNSGAAPKVEKDKAPASAPKTLQPAGPPGATGTNQPAGKAANSNQ